MPKPSFAERFTRSLIHWRWPLLGLAVVVAAVCLRPSRGLQFDQSIENMFAADDPLLATYREFKETFGADEIVLAAYVDDDLMGPSGLSLEGRAHLMEVTQQCRAVPGVAAAQSLADIPLLTPSLLEVFQGYMVGEDRTTTAIVCLLQPAETAFDSSGASIPRAETVDRLREIIRQQEQGVLAGEPVMVVDGFRYLERDGRLLGWSSTVLLVLVMLVCFRSLRWILAPIAVVQLTLLMTQALLVWSGFRLSMVSSMLAANVTIIGVASVMHLIVGFLDRRAEGLSPAESLASAGALLAAPIFGACLTDAVGFGSLLMASVGPIQDFGLMMTVGSLLVLVSIVLIVPAMSLAGMRKTARPAAPSWGQRGMSFSLARVLSLVQRHPKPLFVGAGLLTAAGLWGGAIVRVETDFTKNFRGDSPVVQSYEFVESRLGGAGIWDIVIPAPSPLDWSYLKRVDAFQKRLREEVLIEGADGQTEPGLTKVLSLADVLPATVGWWEDGLASTAALNQGLSGMSQQMPELMKALYRADGGEAGQGLYRIMLRARERQPAENKDRIIAQVRRIAAEEFPEAKVSGFFVLLTYLIDSILRDQWTTFIAATSGIALMLLVAFRSLRLTLIALVPNLLPVFLVMGLMGWLGLKINMGAAMIAAVSMGLSVDSSLHYIVAFQRLRAAGHSVADALVEVQATEGRPIVLTTIALMVGFSSLCLSEFVPTVYFGALVSLTMLGGLVGNLLLLPLLLNLGASRGPGRPV